GDTPNAGEHLLARDALPIGIAKRERNPGAGGSDGRTPRFFDNSGAGDVPSIGQYENLAAAMKRAEDIGFGFSSFHVEHQRLFPRDWIPDFTRKSEMFTKARPIRPRPISRVSACATTRIQ